MIRVLTNDGLQAKAIEALKDSGVEVINEHFPQDILGEKLKEFDALVIRSATKVTADVIDAEKGGNLKLVIRAGVGIDNIDVAYAKENGLTINNTPAASSDSVAELTIAHMFAVARFIGISNFTMRNGEWNKKKYEGSEITGKILGIIGMGRIGQSLAKKATALGMKVVYYTIEGKHDDLDYDFLTFEEVLKQADFLSLHVPYDKVNGSLIGRKELDLMKDSAYIINCARGKVVDEEALLQALNNGTIAGAGIDVFEEEPTKNEKLINHPNVSATPHIGAATKEAQSRIGDEVVSIIKDFFNL